MYPFQKANRIQPRRQAKSIGFVKCSGISWKVFGTIILRHTEMLMTELVRVYASRSIMVVLDLFTSYFCSDKFELFNSNFSISSF